MTLSNADLESVRDRASIAHADASWLVGAPMDPCATTPEPLPPLPGLPFLHEGAGAIIVGPTGGGRSFMVQAGLYDAARGELRCLYLGSEITKAEFDARAATLAELRGDELTDELREELARVRYLDLAEVIATAASDPIGWVSGVTEAYDLVVLDPVSAAASALNLDFDRSNDDWVRFYDKIVQPLTAAGVAVVLIDNVGYAEEAKSRPKGVSAKQDRADLTFSCTLSAEPVALIIKAHKVSSVRAGFQRGDEWICAKETQTIERRIGGSTPTTFRPTFLMEAVSRAVEQTPGLSSNAIQETVQGRAATKKAARELLVAEGFVRVEHKGQEQRHYSVRAFRQDTDSTDSPPIPNQFPESVREPVSPIPTPLGVESEREPVHQPRFSDAGSLIVARANGRISEEVFDREYDRLAGLLAGGES